MTEVDTGVLMSALNNKGIDPGIVAMLNDKCRDGSLGGDWIILLFLFLLGMGGNGFGLGNKGAEANVDRAVASEANYSRLMDAVSSSGLRQEMAIDSLAQSLGCSNQAIQGALAGLDKSLALANGSIVNAIQSTTCALGGKVDAGFMGLQNTVNMQGQNLSSQLSSCCCSTNNNITNQANAINLNIERGNNSIIQAINAQSVLMERGFCDLQTRDLQSEVSRLKDKVFEQSQTAQTATEAEGLLSFMDVR